MKITDIERHIEENYPSAMEVEIIALTVHRSSACITKDCIDEKIKAVKELKPHLFISEIKNENK